MKVTNEWGTKINFEMAVALMDDELREELHTKMAPCGEQEFFDSYCEAHIEKFSEEWELSKRNPVY